MKKEFYYWCVLTGFLLLGVFTLKISPLPWYDEVDFSSITHSYADNKTFVCTANDLYFPVKGKEVLYYGPVYFVLNGAIVKMFGFGIVQCRILNFLAGIICVVLFVKLFERLSGKKYTTAIKIIFALLMFSDYTFFQDMHSGRMDLLALMFALTGLLLADSSSQKKLPRFFLSGFFIAVALLTSPRVYFLVVPYYLYLVYLYFKNRQASLLAGIICAACTTVILYLAWIVLKFGSIQSFANYIKTPATYINNAAGDFFVINSNVQSYQVIYYVVLIVLMLFSVWKNRSILAAPENSTSLLTIVLFLLLVGGSGIYMCLVSGFIYITIMSMGARLMSPRNWAVIFLLVVNFGLIGFKYFVVLGSAKDRDSRNIDKWVQQMISPGSKVVADDKYYYAVIEAQSQFQYFARGGTDAERIKYQRDVWKAGYLLVEDTTSALFNEYRNNATIRLLAEYRPYSGKQYPGNFTASYNGFLYAFIK